jgi:putative tryptophan/tyrosine transport system substrate-binding protein
MRRRDFILGAALAWSPAVRAQEPGRTYRLGIITGAARSAPRMAAFFDELKTLGFVEGQNLKIVAGGFDLRDTQFAQVAANLAKESPDAVFCVSDAAGRAKQDSGRTVPIVALSTDLVIAGLARSLARPGGNVTGVSILASELNGKRQEILMQAAPGARRMAVLADPKAINEAQLQALRNASSARGVELAVVLAGSPEEIAAAIIKAKDLGAAALNVLTSPLFSFNRRIEVAQARSIFSYIRFRRRQESTRLRHKRRGPSFARNRAKGLTRSNQRTTHTASILACRRPLYPARLRLADQRSQPPRCHRHRVDLHAKRA